MVIKRLYLFRLFLILISIHSLCVGLGLILVPLSVYDIFGFMEYRGAFFKTQGGVFHLIMGLVYLQASRDPLKNVSLIWLTIGAKFTATVFLMSYYLFAERIWMVLISGAGDLLMGLIVLLLYRNVSKDYKPGAP